MTKISISVLKKKRHREKVSLNSYKSAHKKSTVQAFGLRRQRESGFDNSGL